MLIESRINFRKKFSSHTMLGRATPHLSSDSFTSENIISLPGLASHEDILAVMFQNTSESSPRNTLKKSEWKGVAELPVLTHQEFK